MKIPLSTYRIQFTPSFTFKNAKGIISYLSNLGISDVYASPVFKARKGSVHGYDTIDQRVFNPELGSAKDFEELAADVKKHSMGWLQDIVPNHMAYDGTNPLVTDILEYGRCSPYFNFFDIEWDFPYENIKGRLLAPFLGKFYSAALEDGEIQLSYDDDGLGINYYAMRLPLKITTYLDVFSHDLTALNLADTDSRDFMLYTAELDTLKELSMAGENETLYSRLANIKKSFREHYLKSAAIKKFIGRNISLFNGEKGIPASFDLLDNLLSKQLFRLSFWKVASEELNYRRFFTINDIISLKAENSDVFGYTHSLIKDMLEKDTLTGIRVDHIDGIYDPASYLKQLRALAPHSYIIVEKILTDAEMLPHQWPVQGTTGYDFLNNSNAVFSCVKNEKKFDYIYAKFTGTSSTYSNIVLEKKRLIIGKYMAGDVDSLARFLKKISSRDRYGSDMTLYGLRRVLVELLAFFPVYRTYVNRENYRETDRVLMRNFLSVVKENNPVFLNELEFIEKFFLFEGTEPAPEQWINFVMRFQQYTGTLMAKGFEDTAIYVYNRLLSRNEVGSNPGIFGISKETFDGFCAARSSKWPHTLNATSSHDTKRGEDARARLNVLSELPGEWIGKLNHWSRVNSKAKAIVKGHGAPSKNDEYFLYQSILGHFPFDDRQYREFIRRLKEYIIKSVREAKVHTAWLKPDSDYENAYLSFIDEITRPSMDNEFITDFLPFQKTVSYYGIFNSLSQILIKITAPGVPDFYQGTELWDLNFVDPDNRRAVDFKSREKMLDEILTVPPKDYNGYIQRLLKSYSDGRIKLFLIHTALKARNENAGLFENGCYVPIESKGKLKGHVLAFARQFNNQWSITVVPRFLAGIISEGEYPFGKKIWRDTYLELPTTGPQKFEEKITRRIFSAGKTIPVSEILTSFPAALLIAK